MYKQLMISLAIASTFAPCSQIQPANATSRFGISPTNDLEVSAASWQEKADTTRTITIALDRQSRSKVTKPRIGVVKEMVMGDLMCYVELADLKGKRYRLGADFSICAKARKYLRKKVRLSYKNIRVNDCQSAEPCGKTRVENLIFKMKVMR